MGRLGLGLVLIILSLFPSVVEIFIVYWIFSFVEWDIFGCRRGREYIFSSISARSAQKKKKKKRRVGGEKKRKLAEYRRVALRTKIETLKREITPSVKIWILIHCNSRMQR